MAITPALIKELREKTSAGMMDCKKALAETNGDMEAAIDWLRTKGLSKAAKKSGRVAAMGLVSIALSEGKGAAVEVNSETDFVAKNQEFQDFVKEVADCALANDGDVAKVQEEKADALTSKIATIGENMTIRRAAAITADSVTGYIHSAIAPNMGSIAVLVGLTGSADKEAMESVGKQIAMHIAAAKPEALSIADVNPESVEREKAVFKEQALESGKTEEIIEKMIDGRIRKFYEEIVLLEQNFVIDPKKKIKDVLAEAGDVKLTAFTHFVLGEGIEKVEENFADEIAKTLG